MTKIYDILDWSALQGHIQRKEITERKHPEFPNLVIYNYADIVAFQGLWTPETRAARGLIVDLESYEVLARPFTKFFNYGQEADASYDLDAPLYHVANKFDGSLGIGYIRPDGKVAIATRGSFESEQAIHATKLIAQDPDLSWDVRTDIRQGVTTLFEIVYPENRIVVDYGDTDALVWLGDINIETGGYARGNRPTGETLRSVLEREPRKNAEGWVVWFDEFTALKIKQEDYIALHRIVTGLNRKSIWRALSQGWDKYQEMLVQLPDELYKWAEKVASELQGQFSEIMRESDEWYESALEYMDSTGADEWWIDFDRTKFAKWVALNVPGEYRGHVFMILDKKDIHAKIWRSIEPKGGDK